MDEQTLNVGAEEVAVPEVVPASPSNDFTVAPEPIEATVEEVVEEVPTVPAEDAVEPSVEASV